MPPRARSSQSPDGRYSDCVWSRADPASYRSIRCVRIGRTAAGAATSRPTPNIRRSPSRSVWPLGRCRQFAYPRFAPLLNSSALDLSRYIPVHGATAPLLPVRCRDQKHGDDRGDGGETEGERVPLVRYARGSKHYRSPRRKPPLASVARGLADRGACGPSNTPGVNHASTTALTAIAPAKRLKTPVSTFTTPVIFLDLCCLEYACR